MKVIKQKGYVGFIPAIKDFYKGFFNFGKEGKTTRAGYFWLIPFIYFYTFLVCCLSILFSSMSPTFAVIFVAIFTLAIFIPQLSSQVRRYRDAGLSNFSIWMLEILGLILSVLVLFGENTAFLTIATFIYFIFSFSLLLVPSNKLVAKAPKLLVRQK